MAGRKRQADRASGQRQARQADMAGRKRQAANKAGGLRQADMSGRKRQADRASGKRQARQEDRIRYGREIEQVDRCWQVGRLSNRS
jgi:hypothetical protein